MVVGGQRVAAWVGGGGGVVAAGGSNSIYMMQGFNPLGDTAEGQDQFLAHQPSNFSPFHTCCSK